VWGVSRLPPVLAESYKNKNARNRIRDIVLRPEFPGVGPSPSNPKSYSTPYGGPGELFWTPAKLSITEAQRNLVLTAANQPINSTPSAQPDGPDYVWHGSTYLEPVFQVANGDALRSESDSSFLSGILFGIAGAAAIAFIQEIPDTFSKPVWWSRRKRKRKSSFQNATGIRVTKESRAPTGLGWPPLWLNSCNVAVTVAVLAAFFRQ
jgi:hypothetical protein